MEEVFKNQVPSDDGLRLAFGQDLVDKIVANTQSGKSRRGGKLAKPYSKGYAKSTIFNIFGKTKSKVNMKLTGAMLDAIHVESITDDAIVIGFGDDEKQTNKAHGHITGNVGVKRDFFGLTNKDVNDVAGEYKTEVDRLVEEEEDNREPSVIELFLLEQLRQQGKTKLGEEGE